MPSLRTAPTFTVGRSDRPFCLPNLEEAPGVGLLMPRTTNILRWFLCLALMELFRPTPITAQDDKFNVADIGFTTPLAWMEKPASTTIPAGMNPLILPSSSFGPSDSRRQTFADTMAFQIDRGSTSAWLSETYVATPPAFLDLHGKEWSNDVAGGGTWFLTKSNTTAAHFMGNLDFSTTIIGGVPFEQHDGSYLTLRWGISHSLLLNNRRSELQIDVAGYSERTVTPPHLPIAFYVADPGYSVSSSGAEATFSLPSRNAVLSVRYGWERMVQQPAHSRLLQLQLSWDW
jgi:hypothetical protein